MNLETATAALTRPHDGTLPKDAMRWMHDNAPEAAPALIAAIERAVAAEELDAELDRLLFFGLHLLGDLRETGAFEPLCRLARQDKKLDTILGDGVTTTLKNILLRTFNGDIDLFKSVIETPEADEYVRSTALHTLSLLTATSAVAAADMADYLRSLPALLQPRAENFIWCEWAVAAGDFGLEDLRPQVLSALANEFVPPMSMDIKDFDRSISEARREPHLARRFARDLNKLFDDSIEELSRWHSFSEEYRRSLKAPPAAPRASPALRDGLLAKSSTINPKRKVGRNDLCPCGSGKKYKKCCLERDNAA